MDPFILPATTSFQKGKKLYLVIGKVPRKNIIRKVSIKVWFFSTKKFQRMHSHPKFHEKINKPQISISTCLLDEALISKLISSHSKILNLFALNSL